LKNDRYVKIAGDASISLTSEEAEEGWHFCYSEWDGMLVGPGMLEYEICKCEFECGKPHSHSI